MAAQRDFSYIYTQAGQKVAFSTNQQTAETAKLIEEGSVFNVLDYQKDRSGIIHPQRLILEPDELIDVSALTACVKPYGASPYHFLLDKFSKKQSSKDILLGQVANQMLDDCVNSESANYNDSLKNCFRDFMLDFCTEDGIDADFFERCKRQFLHIRAEVDALDVDATLEPSFFCVALGLQGRFDLLARDCSLLLELKAGKWDEWNQSAQRAHLLQMLLYKEIMHYNLNIDRDAVRGILFYSKYPHEVPQDSQKEMVDAVLTLRNQIVYLNQLMSRDGGRSILGRLTPDRLRTENCSEKLWQVYCRPQLTRILEPIQNADALAQAYFYETLRFVMNEQRAGRIGTGAEGGNKRVMSNLWNEDLELKRENGAILYNLKIDDERRNADESVEALRFRITDEIDTLPTFRIGDPVVVYQRKKETDSVVNQQILRCSIESFGEGFVWVALRHRQRMNVAKLKRRRLLFAIEHDYVDATSRSLFVGLYSFLTVPAERRDLLLGRRQPVEGKDFALVVGPPGTGKTSVKLRQLVHDFISEGKTLLLLAYTNRAVDEICEMLGDDYDYLRMGKRLSCDERFRNRLFAEQMSGFSRRSEVLERIQSCPIFVATVATMSSHLNLFQIKKFDVAIFDESSQILEPQMLPLLCATRPDGQCALPYFILIGDHKQLPAVVVQEEEATEVQDARLREIGLTNCRNSLFERLHHLVKDDPRFVTFLNRQGRMHPEIADFSNKLFYDSKLSAVPLPHQTVRLPFQKYRQNESVFAQNRMIFVDARPDRNFIPKLSLAEAVTVAHIVKTFMGLYKKNKVEFSPARQVGIIVPFRRQIAAVRHALETLKIPDSWSILIDTVERYQGSQKDIIIFSTTIASPAELENLSSVVDVEGTPIDRKLNVAVTRAREQFILVGRQSVLRQNPLYAQLLDFCAPVPSNYWR